MVDLVVLYHEVMSLCIDTLSYRCSLMLRRVQENQGTTKRGWTTITRRIHLIVCIAYDHIITNLSMDLTRKSDKGARAAHAPMRDQADQLDVSSRGVLTLASDSCVDIKRLTKCHPPSMTMLVAFI